MPLNVPYNTHDDLNRIQRIFISALKRKNQNDPPVTACTKRFKLIVFVNGIYDDVTVVKKKKKLHKLMNKFKTWNAVCIYILYTYNVHMRIVKHVTSTNVWHTYEI